MDMRGICILAIFFVCTFGSARAQLTSLTDSLFTRHDTAIAFTLNEYFSLMMKSHPVAKQAGLLSQVAQQEVRLARGGFDPKFEFGAVTKDYDGKEYYTRVNSSLKFPTASPITPSIAVDHNTGPFLNPESYISNEFDNRQYSVGLSLPLGKGLLIDERRIALQQAKVFSTMAEAEQVKIINKLLLDAAKDYWDWYFAFYRYRLLHRSVKIASNVYNLVLSNYEYGEAAAIDTVQAKITLQQRIIEEREAFVEFKNSGIRLSNALWDSLQNPLSINPRWIPIIELDASWMLSNISFNALTEQALINHPELRKNEAKLKQLELDRRLANENLKPQLDLTYYAINQPLNPAGEINFPGNSYKFGVDVSIPLFLRKERSKLELAKLKIKNTEFEQTLIERRIVNEMTTTFNQLLNLQDMIETQYQMVLNYQALLAAELLNLREGESDLFKISVQQEKYIQSQTKWLKLMADFEKQKAYLYWAAGVALP